MSAPSIEVRHLKYFTAVAEQGSFSRAAVHLHISQPPLTRQIQNLEQQLETKLFRRKPRGVELTAAGEVFLVEAKNILSLIEQAALRTKQVGDGRMGRIDVGIFGSAIYGIIPEIVRAFRNNNPGVDVVLHSMERMAQLKALRERRIAVGFNRFFDQEPDLSWERVHSESLHLALYSEHPFASKKIVRVSELSNQPLILYPKTVRPSFIDYLLKIFHDQEVTPKVAYEVDDVNTAIALVSSGMGLSVVTDSACNLKLPNIRYVPLDFADIAPFDLDVIYRKEDESALLNSFLKTVREFKSLYKSD